MKLLAMNTKGAGVTKRFSVLRTVAWVFYSKKAGKELPPLSLADLLETAGVAEQDPSFRTSSPAGCGSGMAIETKLWVGIHCLEFLLAQISARVFPIL